MQLFGFLSENLDVKIGRQRIAWGTADKLNPTDNLNPYDLEDILDFGRHRGSDAISFDYYFNTEFSLQGAFIPFFQPANMPVGIFANALTPSMEMPPGMTLKGFNDEIEMPKYNLGESSTAGLRFKGFAAGFDFSLSYVWGYDGIPFATSNTFVPVDTLGGININSQKGLYIKPVKEIEILLPPLQTQKQIVSILEKAESLKQKREETNKKTQKIIQSIFYDMFGNPFRSKNDWEKIAINKFISKIEKKDPKELLDRKSVV